MKIPNFLPWGSRRQKKEVPPYSPNAQYEQHLKYIPMKHNYETFVKEGFRSNGPFYRAVSTIIEAIAGLEWGLYTDRSLEHEITSHDVLDLINNPNTYQGTGEYFESLAGYWLLSGNTYMFVNRPTPSAPPVELYTLYPATTRVVPGKFGPQGYLYGLIGQEQHYSLDEVAHLKFFSGNDHWYGLSPAEISAILIDQMNASLQWNAALMQNMARPSGAWVTETSLSTPEFKRLKKELLERYTGTKNAGLPMVLDGNLKWQSTSLTPKEADFLQTIEHDVNWIANILGIAPELAGSGNRTYSNMGEARQALYEDRVFPLADRIEDKLNSWLLPMFGSRKGLYLTYKKDKVEALRNKYEEARKNQEDANKRKQDGVVQLYTNSTITFNEVREALGYKPAPGGDVIKVGSSFVPIDQLATPTPAPALPAPDPNQADPNTLPQDQQQGKAFNLASQTAKEAYLQQVEQTRQKWYTTIEDRFKKHFQEEQQAVKHAVDSSISQHGNDIAAYESVIQQTIESKQTQLHELLAGVYKDVGGAFFDMVHSQLDTKSRLPQERKDALAFLYEATLQFIDTLAGTKVQQVNQTTLDTMRKLLNFGVAEGLGIPEIASMIDLLYLQEIVPNRSTVIARTEVVSASNYGSQEAAKQAQDAGIQLNKVWLATTDSRTRPSHRAADGQEVPLDQPFKLGVHKLMYPGDTSLNAPADETIQCRCTEYYQEATTQGASDTSTVAKSKEPCYNDVRTTKQQYREFMRLVANG